MARAAKAPRTTMPAAARRKPGRPASVANEPPAKAGTPAAATKRGAIAAPASTLRKAGRPAATAVAAKVPPKISKTAIATKRAPAVVTPTPKLTKDELRAQIEKLERANATLRAKSREANKTAKTAAGRIAELEDQVARLDNMASLTALAKQSPKPEFLKRKKRQGREIDPGDAVPPVAAVQKPGPLDEQAETVLETLEEHLGGE